MIAATGSQVLTFAFENYKCNKDYDYETIQQKRERLFTGPPGLGPVPVLSACEDPELTEDTTEKRKRKPQKP